MLGDKVCVWVSEKLSSFYCSYSFKRDSCEGGMRSIPFRVSKQSWSLDGRTAQVSSLSVKAYFLMTCNTTINAPKEHSNLRQKDSVNCNFRESPISISEAGTGRSLPPSYTRCDGVNSITLVSSLYMVVTNLKKLVSLDK